MGSVVDLAAARIERTPHMSGPAVCLSCRHEWAAVAPVGELWLECPACTLVRGRMAYPTIQGHSHWECRCGNDLFRVVDGGVMCPNCGVMQEGYA